MARTPKKLFIGDTNLVWQRLRTPLGENIDSETVTFTVRSEKSYDGLFVGTENNAMPWSATNERYEAVWDQDEALDLEDGVNYWIHIQTLGHGRRLVPCKAEYNEGAS